MLEMMEEESEESEQYPHRTTIEERAVIKGSGSQNRSRVALIDRGNDGGDQDGQEIDEHPKRDLRLGASRGGFCGVRGPIMHGR